MQEKMEKRLEALRKSREEVIEQLKAHNVIISELEMLLKPEEQASDSSNG